MKENFAVSKLFKANW